MFSVIGIDPGVTTGYAKLQWPVNCSRGYSLTLDQDTDPKIITSLIASAPDVLAVVVEKFLPRDKVKIDTTALKVCGYIEALQLSNLVYQLPAHAKFFWTNDKLKIMDMYKPGYPHAMDAARHALTYATQQDRYFTDLYMKRRIDQ